MDGRGDYAWRETKKPKGGKRKVQNPSQVIARPPEPEIIPKGKAAKPKEEEQS